MTALDSKDLKLLARLQKDGQTSAQDLAEHLGMSASQISRRRQRLEAEGYIIGTPCRLNPDKLGLSVQAFIQVETRPKHRDASVDQTPCCYDARDRRGLDPDRRGGLHLPGLLL